MTSSLQVTVTVAIIAMPQCKVAIATNRHLLWDKPFYPGTRCTHSEVDFSCPGTNLETINGIRSANSVSWDIMKCIQTVVLGLHH